MIELLKEFVKTAGQYSLEKKKAESPTWMFKEGSHVATSVVTEVDLYISHLFKDFVKRHFSHLNYMIIDEESLNELGDNVFEKCAQTEYQFVIDPIDGTMNYAADIPLYGVIVGVMKNSKPWLGLVYAPALDELIYTDGENVFFETHGNTKLLQKNNDTQTRVVLGHTWQVQLQPKHVKGRLIMHDYFAAAVYGLFLVLGRVKGAFIQGYLWDYAGSWAMFQVLGIKIYDFDTHRELTWFNPADFNEKCQMKKMYVACFPQHYEEIKALAKKVEV